MRQIINGLRYDTDKAELIADNEWADGNNQYPGGRAQYLYKTEKGNFFLHYATCWQGEHDYIEPIDVDQAKEEYEQLSAVDWNAIAYEDVFGEEVEDA